VEKVLYPALPGAPGHDLWKRDFLGASGLFGIVLKPCSKAAVTAMLDGMELHGMGYSWGGYESLLIPTDIASQRTATPWSRECPTLRIHVGLEEPEDLVADLAAGFERLRKAA
jgi:cystathionine beta-lyase